MQTYQKSNIDQQRYYFVEHLEEYLYEWVLGEYEQMMKYLSTAKHTNLIFTNFNNVLTNSDQEIKQENNFNFKQLQIANKQIYSNRALYLQLPFKDYLELEQSQFKLQFADQKDTKDQPDQQDGTSNSEILIPIEEICLLDLRAEQMLQPSDAAQFKAFLFGGILGDHPPQDRTSQLRHKSLPMRHIGNLQLSTDTAVLVTKLIIEDQIPFEKISFVDEPELFAENDINQSNNVHINSKIQSSIIMEGFRYVKDNYQWQTGKFEASLSGRPLMADIVKKKLLEEDLDFDKML